MHDDLRCSPDERTDCPFVGISNSCRQRLYKISYHHLMRYDRTGGRSAKYNVQHELPDKNRLLKIQIICTAYPLVLIAIFGFLAKAEPSSAILSLIFGIFALIAGMLGGQPFFDCNTLAAGGSNRRRETVCVGYSRRYCRSVVFLFFCCRFSDFL